MASYEVDARGVFYIRFRIGGKNANRSLGTSSVKETIAIVHRVEETLKMLRFGRLVMPPDVDPVDWVIRGGKDSGPSADNAITIADAIAKYFDALPTGAKEDNTLRTEKTHTEHVKRILGVRTVLRTVTQEKLQDYVNARSREDGAGTRRVSPATIKKELVTFHQVWNFAKSIGVVSLDLPRTNRLTFPKGRSRPRFQTYAELLPQARAARTEDQRREIWECLFLGESEIIEVLKLIRESTDSPSWLYPAVSVAAFTGARRSEIMRGQVSDYNIRDLQLRVREKKRVRDVEESSRYVDVHNKLHGTMKEWLKNHPGGTSLFCNADGAPITRDMMNHHLKFALRASKWNVIRGWHVFRHSFASICASRGLTERVISVWMGHETEEMRQRYSHLFPADTSRAMAKLFTR